MKQWLQHHRYALQVTLRRLSRAPFSFLTNVGVIAFALVLPLMGASILISVHPVAQHVSADPTMTIFMTPDASLALTQNLTKRIQDTKDPLILDVRLINKTEAATALRSNEAWRQALEALPDRKSVV